jgi:hypothetical protein
MDNKSVYLFLELAAAALHERHLAAKLVPVDNPWLGVGRVDGDHADPQRCTFAGCRSNITAETGRDHEV